MTHTKTMAIMDAIANTDTATHINGEIGSVCKYCIKSSIKITLFANIINF